MNRRNFITWSLGGLVTGWLGLKAGHAPTIVGHKWESGYLDFDTQHATAVKLTFSDGSTERRSARYARRNAHLYDEDEMIRGEKLSLRIWAKGKYGVYLA